jgi:hypothetical protein
VLGGELLYLTYAKMARRIRKLENLGCAELFNTPWMSDIKANMVEAHALINQGWKALTARPQASFETKHLRDLRPAKDIGITIPELDVTLTAIAARLRNTARVDFVPNERYPTYSPDEIPTTLITTGDLKCFRLEALEAWVEQHLQSWIMKHPNRENVCGQLRRLMELYYPVASTAYTGMPAKLSVMYLSLVDIWVACDKEACLLYPLLCQYDPELNLDEFQCLLYPREARCNV